MVGVSESMSAAVRTVKAAHLASWFARVFLPQNGFVHVRHRRCAPGSRVRGTAAHAGAASAAQCVLACFSAVDFDTANPQMRQVSFCMCCITPGAPVK